ncbi:MAG: ADP-ribosylation factor family protein [Promethearchaeia archaeon]
MKILVLSYFDNYLGPEIFLVAPENFPTERIKYITNFLDIDGDKFFIHEFDEFKSVNLKFELKSESARGRLISLMISILYIDENPNIDVLKEILITFKDEFKKIQDIDDIFSVKNAKNIENNKKLIKIKDFFYKFYDSLPVETTFTKQRNARIFMFGLDFAGKTTIINRLKENIFTNPKPTTNINIVRLLFENLSITIYDAGGQEQYRKIWSAYLKNQDGLIFTLDVSDEKRFDEAYKELYRILNFKELENLPLLILFNKIDLKKPKEKELIKKFDLDRISNRPIKYFFTSALTNEGIFKAFNWIALQVLNRLYFKN